MREKSALELELIELIRAQGAMSTKTIEELYPPDTALYGSENRALTIALSNLRNSGILCYRRQQDAYTANVWVKPDHRTSKIMELFMKLTDDAGQRRLALLNSSKDKYYDLAYPVGETYIYLLYVDSIASATKIKHLVNDIKSRSEEVDHIKIKLIVLRDKDLQFCKTEDIPTDIYMLDGEDLKEVS